jgi:phenylacetate-coenzyme A ligase PaaK-like adenylate-forming protein
MTQIDPSTLYSDSALPQGLVSSLGEARGASYWSERFKSFATIPTSKAEFSRLPLLDRRALSSLLPSALSSCSEADVLGEFETSGTTGRPLKIRYSFQLMSSIADVLSSIYKRIGIGRHSRVALAYRSEKGAAFAMHAAALNRNSIEYFFLDVAAGTSSRELIRREKATALFGPASVVLAIADAEQVANSADSLELETVICSGMPMSHSGKQFVEGVFRCKVFRCAGATEVSLLAFECPQFKGMHALDKLVFAELADRVDSDTSGQVGQLIVSSLRNRACHLFRYSLGDIASFDENVCICGDTSPRVEILGRRDDAVRLNSDCSIEAWRLQRVVNRFEGLTGGFRFWIGTGDRTMSADWLVEAWAADPAHLWAISAELVKSFYSTQMLRENVLRKRTLPQPRVQFIRPGRLGHHHRKYRRVMFLGSENGG